MSPNIRHKYKYFHSTVQRAKRQTEKFHFCGLPFDLKPRNVKLNLCNDGFALQPKRAIFSYLGEEGS